LSGIQGDINKLAATIIITIKGKRGMSHNNYVSARGGTSFSVVNHCQVAGIAGQRFTNIYLWEEGEGLSITYTPN